MNRVNSLGLGADTYFSAGYEHMYAHYPYQSYGHHFIDEKNLAQRDYVTHPARGLLTRVGMQI